MNIEKLKKNENFKIGKIWKKMKISKLEKKNENWKIEKKNENLKIKKKLKFLEKFKLKKIKSFENHNGWIARLQKIINFPWKF